MSDVAAPYAAILESLGWRRSKEAEDAWLHSTSAAHDAYYERTPESHLFEVMEEARSLAIDDCIKVAREYHAEAIVRRLEALKEAKS